MTNPIPYDEREDAECPSWHIVSRCGQDYGVWPAATAADALAAMHCEAGYSGVRAVDGVVHFPDAECERICGGLDAWMVSEVSRQHDATPDMEDNQ